ncbi:MAG: hypothetical protein AAGD43_18950 [Pseudomonadota bacterium]
MGDEAQDVQDVTSFVVGAAVGGASNAGWPDGAATLIAMRALDGVTGRMAAGEKLAEAFSASVVEAEMVMIMDRFSKSLHETDNATVAFDAAMECKRQAFEGVEGADLAIESARAVYGDALNGGLTPHAALLSAYIRCASIMRKAAGA